jgi:hypothetical protein
MNRDIKIIVIHSTQTHSSLSVETIRNNWKINNQRSKFHCVIDRYGHAARILGMNLIADQNIPQNESCFHIAYIGGLIPADTRTPLQTHILFEKIEEMKKLFPNAVVIGAGEFTGEQNPGFDVESWLNYYRSHREDWIALDIAEEAGEEKCLLED